MKMAFLLLHLKYTKICFNLNKSDIITNMTEKGGTTIEARYRPDTESAFTIDNDQQITLLAYTERMEQLSIENQYPIFWQRPDLNSILVAVPYGDNQAITVTNLEIARETQANGKYSGYILIDNNERKKLRNSLKQILQAINITHPQITSLRVVYRFKETTHQISVKKQV